MKVLFDHASPFALAHGGFQTQIEESKTALERLGVETEHLRWWDDRQKGDLIHFWGVPSRAYLSMAREKGIPVIVDNLFTATCNRSPLRLKIQGAVTRALLALPGWGMIKNQLNWQSFRMADHLIVSLQAERRVLRTVFGLPDERITTVPYGLHRDFIEAGKGARSEPCLITTGTITERKRNVELALMAREAQVPILFVGKPYSRDNPYWKKFEALIDNRFVFHRNHVDTRAGMIDLLKSSRGFVIYSQYENWCLSAHEAAACGLPLLVPDLPWSRECFGAEAGYLHPGAASDNPARLRSFYEKCPGLPAPAIKFYSWDEVAGQLKACYQSLVKS
ncbi:MAG TPA: glycosyltransferase [Candidatus Methylacidiphilales bacterium]|jgi:glycosyltransferase involved in cell wall biosynthesis|nr:glycosyltransferase [Candidatus Methylacidiphilales bacterium]